MAKLDIVSVLYLSFRLAPFIIVSFFSLSSIIHQDFKGLIYLGGLLLTSFIAILFGNMFQQTFNVYREDQTEIGNDNHQFLKQVQKCNLITLTESGPLSLIPLNIVVFTYTFAYLLTIIIKNKLEKKNIPTLVIFPLLILSEIIWSMRNNCSNFLALLAGIAIGGLCGTSWSFLIDKSGMTNLKYYNGISTQVTCSSPSTQKFKCTKRSS